MITEHEILMWLIPGFSSVLCLVGLGILKELRKVTEAIQDLTVKTAVVIQRVDGHEARIDALEDREDKDV